MQVVQRRSSKSQKAVAGVLAAAVAGLGLYPAVTKADTNWSASPTAPYNWSTPGNWQGGVAPVTGDGVNFDATSIPGYAPVNDLGSSVIIAGIGFGGGAGQGYTLSGAALNLNGDINNASGFTNNINMDLILRSNINIATGGQVINLNGGVSSIGTVGITKNDAGTVSLTGVSTYNGQSIVNNGVFNLSGSLTQTSANATVLVGQTQNAVVSLTGNANWVKTAAPVLEFGWGSGGNGALIVNAGTVMNTSSQIWLGSANGGSGSILVSGGSLTLGDWLALGRARSGTSGAGTGTVRVTSGLLTVNGDPVTIGSFNNGSPFVNQLSGVVTVSGGAMVVNNSIRVSETYDGNLNVLGGGLTVTGNIDMVNGGNATTGVFTMNGGSLSVTDFRSSGGNVGKMAVANFNGGIVQARGASGAFIAAAISNVYVWNGGLNIDDLGNNLGIQKPLLAPSGNGISAAGLTVSGSGYVGEPEVQITGGGGVGASAVANIDASGNLLGITIVSAGSGYTAAPTITILGGGGSPSVSGSPTLVPNSSTGGLSKIGGGTLTMSGSSSTYSGPTVISGGLTLSFANTTTNVISPSSALTLNAARLTLNGAASSTNTQTFNGTTINAGVNNIVLNPQNLVNNTLVLNLGALTRNAAAVTDITLPSGAGPATYTVNTTTPNVNVAGGSQTILGGWATVNAKDWAVSGTGATPGAITALATYSSTFSAGTNVSAAGTTAPGAVTINSLRFADGTGPTTVNLGGDVTIATGGILETAGVGANAVTINNANLLRGAGQDMIIQQFNTSSALTINSVIAASGSNNLIKVGAGKLVLGNIANTYNGKTYLYGGTTTITAENSLGAVGVGGADKITMDNGAILQLGASGVSISSTRGITLGANGGGIDTNTFDSTYGGVITGAGNLTKTGTGNLTLSNVNTFSGALLVTGGSVTLPSGGVVNTLVGFAPTASAVGTVANVPAAIVVSGGTLGANKLSSPSLNIAPNSNSQGYLFMTSGVVNTGSELHVGNGGGGLANLSISGGAVNTGSYLVIGFNNDRSILNQTGGAINIGTNVMTVGAGGTASIGVANLSGGTFTSTSGTNGGMFVGEVGTGILNMSGSAIVTLANNGLRVAVNNNASGIVNLGGGTLATNRVLLDPAAGATVTSLLNFHGGTLLATTASTQFILNSAPASVSSLLRPVYIYSEGGTIDDGGFAVTVTTPLSDPSGSNGVTTIPISNGGTGYISAPIVNITSAAGAGVGASAVANIAGGVITSISITNPGVGYTSTSAPTVSLFGGGGTGALLGTAGVGANAAGGTLTKLGSGTLTISHSANTFLGPINVAAGNLRPAGAILASPITVQTGASLSGTGTLTGSVTVLGGANIDLINNAAGTLTMGAGLTVGGGSVSNLKFDFGGNFNSALSNDVISLGATAFNVTGSGAQVSLNNLGFSSTGQSYTLMTYTGGNADNTNVTLAPTSTKIGFDNASLAVDSSKVVVTITGGAIPPNAWWTGQFGGLWSAIGGAGLDQSNFNTLQSGGVNTQKYPTLNPLAATNVFFSTTSPGASSFDTTLGANFGIRGLTVKGGVAGQTAVTISGNNTLTIDVGGITVESGGTLTINANVGLNANQTWSNASARALTVNGVISGGTAATMTTAGLISLNGANTYAGGTTLGASTLVLGNATALGSGPLTFNSGGNGRVQVNGQTVTVGGLNGASDAIVENTATGAGGLVVSTATGTNTFFGTIQNGGSGNMNFRLQNGTSANGGTLTLGNVSNTAQVNTTGSFVIRAGTLNATNAAINLSGNLAFNVGDTSGSRARLIVDNGTSITTPSFRGSFQVGTPNTAAIGDIRMSNGVITTTGPAGEFWLGEEQTNNTWASMTMSGGALNSGSYIAVAFNADRAVFNISGTAQVNVGSNVMTIGAGGVASYGVVNISGGQLSAVSSTIGGIYVGEGGEAHLEISGTGVVRTDFNGLRLSQLATSTGVVNLRGGTLAVNRITGIGNGNLNFNGGILMSSGGSATGTILSGINSAIVWSGGAVIDDNGNTTQITMPLTAPSGSGVNNTTLAVTGYTNAINTPLVNFSLPPGAGTLATGLANIDAAGNVTSITVTNPGTGYTAAPTVSLTGAGFTQAAGTNSSIAAVTIGANVTTGGLTKNGSGSLTLTSNANNYGGPTVINNGTLLLAPGAALGGNGLVTVNGGAFLAPQGSTIAGSVTINGGTLKMANNQPGTVTLGPSTTFTGGTMTVDVAAVTNDVVNTGQLVATNGVVSVNNLGLQPGHTYTIANFGSATYGTFTLDPSTTTFGLNTVSLVENATSLQLQVNGPTLPSNAYWTGTNGPNWSDLSGSNTNFNVAADNGAGGAAANTLQLPGITTNVFFGTSTPTPTNLTSNLGFSMAIASLTVNSGNNVTINGSSTAVLDIEGSGGITIAAGASLILNSDVVLGTVQNWTNNTGAPFIVTGNLSGAGGINLTGDLTLNSSANTFTGGVTIGAGNTVLLNSTGGLGFGPTTFNSGGKVNINGVNSNIGAPVNSDSSNVIQNVGSTTATATIISKNTSNTWSGTIKDGSTTMNFALSAPTAADFGTLTLASSQSYTGSTQVRRGELIVAPGVAITGTGVSVGNLTGSAVMVLSPGASINTTANPGVQMGAAAGGNGVLINNGSNITTAQEFWIGVADGGYGKYEQNGGTLTSGSWFAVSRGGGNGLVNLNGGLIQVNSNQATLGSFTGAQSSEVRAQVNVNGGMLRTVNNVWVAEYNSTIGKTVLNIGGTGQVVAGTGVTINVNAGSTAIPMQGIVNLNGGTLTTNHILSGGAITAGTRRDQVNFNGGMVQAADASDATFITGLSSSAAAFSGLYVLAGGANIDTGSQSLTITDPLTAPSGNGVSFTGATFNNNGGYVAEPIVSIDGGPAGGFGATASASIDPATGMITGITLTSPGSGYTAIPRITLIGGGGSATLSGAALLANNIVGGLTKFGSGSLILTGAGATYRGMTNITAGALLFSNGNAQAGGITGAGRAVVPAGSTLTSDGSTVNTMQVDGTWVVRPNGTSTGASKPALLTIAGNISAWTGKVDLKDNALILPAASSDAQANLISVVKDQLTSGKLNNFNGTGITSTTLQNASVSSANTLALVDAGDLSLTTYRGQSVDANSTIVVLAHNGDATLDGKVDAFDLNILAGHWQQPTGAIWSNGDFTGDGKVDAFDLNVLAANWQFGVGGGLESALAAFPVFGSAAAAAVPEPASLAVLALGGAALLGRRRRKA